MKRLAGLVSLLALVGCAEKKQSSTAPADAVAQKADGSADIAMVAPRESAKALDGASAVRVGGDTDARAVYSDGAWRHEKMLIDTPLPAGYPAPTPPGAIELKQYPGVRRAQVSRTGLPDVGMNVGFWPLFQHIKRRDIAMTSPVEMEYSGVEPRAPGSPQRDYQSTSGNWTMSFLYRTPDLGPLGGDKGGVEVVDVEPMTVLAVGFRGAYGVERVEAGLYTLERWLAGQSEWERAGEPRALYYNGPERRGGLKWGEVQVPVRRRSGAGS